MKIDDKYRVLIYLKTKEEIQLIENVLNENFVFSNSSENEANTLEHTIEFASSTIIRKGKAVEDYFYVVKI